MFWQNVRSLPIQFSKWLVLHVQTRSYKISKGEIIKSIRREDNMFFGKLVETKKQKIKRLKLESAGKLRKSTPSTTDSELAWVLNTCKNLNVYTVQSRVAPTNIQASLHEKGAEQQASEKAMKQPDERADDQSQDATRKVQGESQRSNSSLLSKVIVQQLLQFPISQVAKTSKNQWDDNFKILSLSAMENKACLKYPSVTKILSATMSEEAKSILEKWKIKMIEKLGPRGFEIYQAELFEDGKLLHSIIKSFLTQKPYDVPDKIKPSFTSLDHVLNDIDQVKAIESHVIHSRLMYRGILDCIASYRGELCLIDWKKSDKSKNTINATYDAPLQLASYIGAVNSDPNYPFQIRKGLIVIAYTNGEAAKVHEINECSLNKFWKLWLQRLQDYHIAFNPS